MTLHQRYTTLAIPFKKLHCHVVHLRKLYTAAGTHSQCLKHCHGHAAVLYNSVRCHWTFAMPSQSIHCNRYTRDATWKPHKTRNAFKKASLPRSACNAFNKAKLNDVPSYNHTTVVSYTRAYCPTLNRVPLHSNSKICKPSTSTSDRNASEATQTRTNSIQTLVVTHRFQFKSSRCNDSQSYLG